VLRNSEAMSTVESTVGVSAGTAAALGLQCMRQIDAPTTAYLMVGERCRYDCAFCAQAHSSQARAHWLSRVVWPPYPLDEALGAVARGFELGEIVRCCLQVTMSPGYLARTLSLAQQLHAVSRAPLCASIIAPDLDSVGALLDSGVERVSLALDAACERVYEQAKGGTWQRQMELLRTAARRFPGRIGTHLIAGLGETEQEMSTMLQSMLDQGITVGLFSFTPVPGTRWSERQPPAIASYRRIQAALYILATGDSRVDGWRFSATGQIVSYGLAQQRLRDLLADGRAFQTAGCPGCNRPYYNERPGKLLYNYPRPLHGQEVEEAVSLVCAELEHE